MVTQDICVRKTRRRWHFAAKET